MGGGGVIGNAVVEIVQFQQIILNILDIYVEVASHVKLSDRSERVILL